MLFLIFHLGAERYALDCRQIVAVLPQMPLKTLPGTPAWVAGVLPYQGSAVPVIDVPALALGRPAASLLSTRMVLVDYPDEAAGPGAPMRRLGLVVEQATRTLRCDAEQFMRIGLSTPHARYLGPVVSDVEGMIQRIEVTQLLPDEVKLLLFEPEPADER
jgi:chemotaxis-related protein WspB